MEQKDKDYKGWIAREMENLVRENQPNRYEKMKKAKTLENTCWTAKIKLKI